MKSIYRITVVHWNQHGPVGKSSIMRTIKGGPAFAQQSGPLVPLVHRRLLVRFMGRDFQAHPKADGTIEINIFPEQS